MDDKIATLASRLGFEDIDEHDVYHRLDQDIGAVGSNIVDAFDPPGVVVILLDAEL